MSKRTVLCAISAIAALATTTGAMADESVIVGNSDKGKYTVFTSKPDWCGPSIELTFQIASDSPITPDTFREKVPRALRNIVLVPSEIGKPPLCAAAKEASVAALLQDGSVFSPTAKYVLASADGGEPAWKPAEEAKAPDTPVKSADGDIRPARASFDILGIRVGMTPVEVRKSVLKTFADAAFTELKGTETGGQYVSVLRASAKVDTTEHDEFLFRFTAPPSGNGLFAASRTVAYADHGAPPAETVVNAAIGKFGKSGPPSDMDERGRDGSLSRERSTTFKVGDVGPFKWDARWYLADGKPANPHVWHATDGGSCHAFDVHDDAPPKGLSDIGFENTSRCDAEAYFAIVGSHGSADAWTMSIADHGYGAAKFAIDKAAWKTAADVSVPASDPAPTAAKVDIRM